MMDIENMTIEEKLQAMELLWDDLCRNAADFVTPEWHKDVLAQREERLRNGKERILDWEQAKKEIEESLPQNPDSGKMW